MSNSVATAVETERKYETDETVHLPDPFWFLGSAVAAEPQVQELSATYFDTADLRLLRAGVTLRRRTGGHDAGWHLKLPIDADTREELSLPPDSVDVPAELLALTRLPARGEPIVPVARLDTLRRRHLLSDSSGRKLAEVVTDEVHAIVPESDTPDLRWREIEVELGSNGGRELLDRIEKELFAVGARRSAAPSKLARALGGRLDAARAAEKPAVRLGKKSAGAALLAYLRERAEQIRANDFGVRRDLPDAVHQMRVGSREMRSALQAYRRLLDPEATRPLIEDLKWLGGELAPARDTEVVTEAFGELIEELPHELVLGAVRAQLARTMAGRAREGRERAIAALDSERYVRLHKRIDELLADPPLTRRAGRPAAKELPRSVAKAYRRTAERVEQALAGTPGEGQDFALHEARKAAKRLRYATELAAPAMGGGSKRLKSRLKDVHKLLGAHQDAVVARPVLRSLAAAAHAHGANGFTFGVLYGEQSRRAAELRQQVPAAWRKLVKQISRGPFRV